MSWITARRRHPAAGYAALVLCLVLVGMLYAVFTGSDGSAQAAPGPTQGQLAQGKDIFEQTCASCHGVDAQGTVAGPGLVGAGAAAVDFQMSTGRMPAAENGAENNRKPVKFSPEQIDSVAGWVASLGGGPAIPDGQQVSSAGANTALGEELFSANCAACHGFAGAGGALTYGKAAPALNQSTPTQIYEAMLTGPEAMPAFPDGSVSPAAKRDIVAFVTQTRAEANPGGFSLGRNGPVTEGLVVWLGGMTFLVLIAMWITAKRRKPASITDVIARSAHGHPFNGSEASAISETEH